MKTTTTKTAANRSKRRPARKGATTVEFAVVCPIILLIGFGMIELSRAQTVVGAARTSVFAGAREAAVANTNVAKVEAAMEKVLSTMGVSEYTIAVNPENLDSAAEVTVEIDVPFSITNGLVLSRYVSESGISLSTTTSR